MEEKPKDTSPREIDSLVKAMLKKENLLSEQQPANAPPNPLSNLKNILSHADAAASSAPPEKPEISNFHSGPVVELDKLIKAYRAERLK